MTTNHAGLTSSEVLVSRAAHGSNSHARKKRRSFLKSFASNFGDPMIKILLLALGINVVFLFNSGNWLENFGIAAAILIAVIVSTISEYGSESAFEKLLLGAMDILIRVRRDGQTALIPITDIVVGDIILLGSGDKIPADGIIVGGNIEVDQSLLNGESKEANKMCNVQYTMHKDGKDKNKKTNDFLNPSLLFSGTVVTNGEGVMKVTAVGSNTVYGQIASELQDDTPQSPLKLKLEKLAKMISVIGYIGAGLVAISYMFNVFVIDNNFEWAKITASFLDFKILLPHLLSAATLVVSVIVMAVPEGLPMMIAVVLSSNMKHMLRDNVLVRKPIGIETAGSMNILFTDKTGTLTNGKLEVVDIITGDDITFDKRSEVAKILSLSLRYNNGSEMSGNRAIGGNSTDRILLEYAQQLPSIYNVVKGKSLPFSSVNKFMATHVSGDRNMMLVKGAPEIILAKCNKFITSNGGEVELTLNSSIYKTIDRLTSTAHRLIAVAVSNEEPEANLATFSSPLTLVAVIAIRDQVRSTALASVAQIKAAGIHVVMITGDAKGTAEAIAREVGIISSQISSQLTIPSSKSKDVVLTSEEMAGLTDEELEKILPNLRVVARALPSDKSRLVRIAQRANLVTGMTGDGVNDAPALKKADIGFAMGSGTEVAKEAADIVILDDNINSISRATSYGRTIFKSIRKFLIFKLTINFCAMAVSIIAPLLNIDTPITVIQMLWINLVMDTLAGLAFGGERPRKKYMQESPKKRDEPIVNKDMWQQILVSGIYTALISLWFLKSDLVQVHFRFESTAYAMTAFFAFFMFINIINSFNARTPEINLLDYLSLNKPFFYIMGIVTAVQVTMIYLGGSIFRTEGLSIQHFLLVALLALTIIPVDMIRKAIMKQKKQ